MPTIVAVTLDRLDITRYAVHATVLAVPFSKPSDELEKAVGERGVLVIGEVAAAGDGNEDEEAEALNVSEWRGALTAQLAALQAEREAALRQRDDALDKLTALQAERDALTQQRDDARAQVRVLEQRGRVPTEPPGA